jgi:hypothetical protein
MRCPSCGARVTPAQKACATCFTDLPWISADTEGGQPGKIVVLDVSYIGALPNTRPTTDGLLQVSDEGIAIVGGHALDDMGTIVSAELALPGESIVAAAVEDREEVEKRVTAARVILVGVWALLWKKEHKASFLVVETKDGIAIFKCGSLTPLELRARLWPWLSHLTHGPEVEAVTKDNPSERLRRVTELHAQGLLSDDEFESKRAEIIADL